MKQSAKVICDSEINGERITTIQYSIWRSLHSELLTYRRCARNASSSRAIPFTVTFDAVTQSPFIPDFIGKTHKGMSPSEFLDGESLIDVQQSIADFAEQTALFCKHLSDTYGVSKSILNRYLEPFNTINVLMTGSQEHWEWLFEQRSAPDAEPNLSQLVLEMRQKYNESTAIMRLFHLPFIDEEDADNELATNAMLSAARCARLSYTPYGEPTRDKDKDFKLAERLLESRHLSPFETQVFDKEYIMDNGLDGVSVKKISRRNAISDSLYTFRQLLGY